MLLCTSPRSMPSVKEGAEISGHVEDAKSHKVVAQNVLSQGPGRIALWKSPPVLALAEVSTPGAMRRGDNRVALRDRDVDLWAAATAMASIMRSSFCRRWFTASRAELADMFESLPRLSKGASCMMSFLVKGDAVEAAAEAQAEAADVHTFERPTESDCTLCAPLKHFPKPIGVLGRHSIVDGLCDTCEHFL
jgi:hypothetical protein